MYYTEQPAAYSSSKAKLRSTQRRFWKQTFSVWGLMVVWQQQARFLKNKKRDYQNASSTSILWFPGLLCLKVEEKGIEVRRLVPRPGNILIFHQQWATAGKIKKKKKKSLAIAGHVPGSGQVPNSNSKSLAHSTEQFYATHICNCMTLKHHRFSFTQEAEVSSRGNKSKNWFSILNRLLITRLKAEEAFSHDLMTKCYDI